MVTEGKVIVTKQKQNLLKSLNNVYSIVWAVLVNHCFIQNKKSMSESKIYKKIKSKHRCLGLGTSELTFIYNASST